jgi:hypothetical protein
MGRRKLQGSRFGVKVRAPAAAMPRRPTAALAARPASEPAGLSDGSRPFAHRSLLTRLLLISLLLTASVYFLHPQKSSSAPLVRYTALRNVLAATEPASTAELLRVLNSRSDVSTVPPCSASSRLPAVASWRVVWPHGSGESSSRSGESSVGGSNRLPCYAAGAVHVVQVTALDAAGSPLCRGGDLLEAWLQGEVFRARVHARDYGNGTYALLLNLPADEVAWGVLTLTVAVEWLSYSGLATAQGESRKRGFVYPVPPTQLRVATSPECAAAGAASLGYALEAPPPTEASCRSQHFTALGAGEWEGHWVRLRRGSGGGGKKACQRGVCTGHPERLGSDWVYRLGGASAQSASCHMHVFSPFEARACLNTSWLYLSGDSTFRDSGRNLLTAVLDANMSGWAPYSRSIDYPAFRPPPSLPWSHPDKRLPLAKTSWTHWPGDAHSGDWRLRVSNVFNGHTSAWEDFMGLATARDTAWRAMQEELLASTARNAEKNAAIAPAPTVFIVTSGPHDAVALNKAPLGGLKEYSENLAHALQWWQRMEELAAAPCDGTRGSAGQTQRRRLPRRFWRTSPAPSNEVKLWEINTQRMELYDRAAREALAKQGGADAGALTTATTPVEAKRAECRAAAPPPLRGGAAATAAEAVSSEWELLDYYDLTFVWHFPEPDEHPDYGIHYGNEEHNAVDVMALHVLLNSLCPL